MWKWDPVKDSLGWLHCDWHTTAGFVRKGLGYWKRELISTASGTQYLLSVASEGGIPVNVLARDGAAFTHYLRSLVRDYGLYGASGLSAEKIAEENLYRLPESWRRPQIVALAGQIVERVWYYKSVVGASTDPVTELDRAHPGWSEQFPLDFEHEQANLIVNALIRAAKEASSDFVQYLSVERGLARGLAGWRLQARFLIPKRFALTYVSEVLGQPKETLPDRLELYRSVAGNRSLLARLAKQTDRYSVRPVLGAIQAVYQDVEKDQEVILVHRGSLLASLPIAGGGAMDNALPWNFVAADDLGQSYKFVSQGGCIRREPLIYTLSCAEPVSVGDDGTRMVAQVEEHVLGRSLWKIDKPCVISDEEGGRHRIDPGLERIAARDYQAVGRRRYFPITRFPLYTELPRFQWLEEGASGYIPRDELIWRPIGQTKWLPIAGNTAIFGDVEIRHFKNDVALAAWRIAILPSQVKLDIEAIDRLAGRIRFSGLAGREVRLTSGPLLECDTETTEATCEITCRRRQVAQNEVDGLICGELKTRLLFTIPFPAEGAAFVDGAGAELADQKELTLSRLYGIRAQSISLDNRKRFFIRGTVLSHARNLSAIQHHWIECPMLRDESGISNLPLQQIAQEIAGLFAIGMGVDDQVKVDLLEFGRTTPISSVLVKQFEGTLMVDTMSRVVTLYLDEDKYSEYAGVSLRLTSINDFAIAAFILPWNDSRRGWSLPDHSEMDMRHTYFATIEGEAAQLIRPCIIPGEGTVPVAHLSEFRRALLIPSSRARVRTLEEVLSHLNDFSCEEGWRELLSALKRFSNVHPDGVDLVECLIQKPRLMAKLWFSSIGDRELRSYLGRITETSPFSWWMVRAQDWVDAAREWHKREVEGNSSEIVAAMCAERAVTELKQLAEVEEELNASVDLMLEQFNHPLPNDSVIKQARARPISHTWKPLDMLARGWFINEIGEADWPVIHQVFELQTLIPDELSELIDWPVRDMGHQKSVMQAGVVAAAALHSDIGISMNHRIALMAARSFHPSAFATNFRATQAALWADA